MRDHDSSFAGLGFLRCLPHRVMLSVRRVQLSIFRGRARIWGTSNPRYWASFDPGRPRKQAGFVVDTGRFVRALLTPDDPDAFEAEVRLHVTVKSGSSAGPFV